MEYRNKTGGLFSCIGGFEFSFSQTGFENKWAIENDPYAASTYRQNFPDHHLIEKDIKLITSKEMANNQLYKQAGNAVTVPLVKKIAVAIKKTLED